MQNIFLNLQFNVLIKLTYYDIAKTLLLEGVYTYYINIISIKIRKNNF